MHFAYSLIETRHIIRDEKIWFEGRGGRGDIEGEEGETVEYGDGRRTQKIAKFCV